MIVVELDIKDCSCPVNHHRSSTRSCYGGFERFVEIQDCEYRETSKYTAMKAGLNFRRI